MVIGILNCDLDNNEVTNGGIIISGLLEESKVYNVCKNEFPESVDECNGYIITGSHANIFMEEEWIEKLKAFVIDINRKGIYCLGICFGMQLVTEIFGGTVKRKAVNERGFVNVNFVKNYYDLYGDTMLKNFSDSHNVYQFHLDAIDKVPKNSVVFSKNDVCVQGFILDNFFCVQFHPEINGLMAKHMCERDSGNVDEAMNGEDVGYDKPQSLIYNFENFINSF